MAPLREDWLKLDGANVQSVEFLATQQHAELPKVVQQLMPCDKRIDRSLGFGFQQILIAKYGGYSTLWIKFLALDSKVVALESIQSGSSDEWKKVSVIALEKTHLKPHQVKEDQIVWSRHVDEHAISTALEKSFGPIPPRTGLEQLKDSYELLTSPFDQFDVGETCYDGGETPAGKKAIDEICKAERFDLAKAVLRGVNPEGRTYAAVALIANHKNDANDTRIIKLIEKADVPVSTCNGCEVTYGKFEDLVHLPNADKN